MPERFLEISREGTVLGSLAEAEVLELVRVGFLKPSDHYTYHDTSGPTRPLSELAPPASPASPAPSPTAKSTPWVQQARASVSAAAGAVTGTASHVAGRLKSLTGATLGKTSQVATMVLQGYLPQLRRALAALQETKPVAAVRAGFRNDETMRKVFGALYDTLPKPVGRFVNEAQFIQYCMDNRAKLLGPPPEQKDPES
jgi:hypothetical protein